MTDLKRMALVGLALLAWVGLLNAGVLAAGWRWDDTQILLHAHQYSIWQDFLVPQIWQQFSPANLTPWLIFSFEVDMALFGLNPTFFYIHQLLAIWAAGCLMYLCLTLWCRPLFAVGGALLFLSGLPVMLVAEQLMTRHYIEGLVFSLMALYAFVMHLRYNSRVALLFALLMYVLAVSAKEIYVPLPAVLLVLPASQWRARLRAAAPFFLVTAIYALWRSFMLDSVSGGYVDSSEYLSVGFVSDVLQAFMRFPALLAGSAAWVLVLVLMVLWGGCLFQSLKQGKVPWLALVIAAAVLLPLAPLVRSPGITLADRYLLLPWAVVSFSMAWCASRLAGVVNVRSPVAGDAIRALPFLAIPLVIPLVIVMTLLHAFPVRQAVAASGKEFDVQAVFLWNHDNSVAYLPSHHALNAFWFATGLQTLKQRITGLSSPVAVVDEMYLTQVDVDRLFTYQSDCQCMQDVTGQIAELRAQFFDRTRESEPLSLTYSYQQGYFAWQFGPWQEGSYHVVSDRLGVLPLPASGRLRVTLEDNVPFYLRYTSAQGWVTYSALQRVVHDSPDVNWSRN